MKMLLKMLFTHAYTANPINADGASRRTAAAMLTAVPHCPKPPRRKRRF